MMYDVCIFFVYVCRCLCMYAIIYMCSMYFLEIFTNMYMCDVIALWCV